MTKQVRRWLLPAGIILIGFLLVIGTHFDQALYQTPIVQITKVANGKPIKQVDQFKNVDHQTNQILEGKLLNGHYQGKHVKLYNTYTTSGAYDQQYKVGQEVFVTLRKDGTVSLIQGLKRDVTLAFLVWLAVSLLFVIMRTSGMLALLSVCLNMVLFFLAITLNLMLHSSYFLLIFASLAVIFAALTLWLVLGPTRQMLVTFGATLVGTSVALLLSLIVMQLTGEKGIYYESMQYVTQVAPRPLFFAETLLGSLGAVMDESTDIVATLFQLREEQPDISAKTLFNSGRQIGRSIMGPLVNVLFLIFVAETFPMAILFLKNGNTWGYTFSMNMSLGVTQSLISGVGIVLAVPMASFLASLLMTRGKAK
ncbi:hypothetical protein BSQ39_01320 [Loigolactobacillus backii]|uniref:YibE/F family protein n=1 Tax=Loigolactobacillus backii TaxID=375175 RepID=UPI000C1C9AA0|nr:YibE/F family protein [Loigolactobacillus backii]PIO82296.1 hypothetical protein BSQ39_01320 [Loigolactobacillus backii]